MADLGYPSWLKAYGLVGLVWLGVLFYQTFTAGRRVSRTGNAMQREMGAFALSYAGFVALSSVTLPHLLTSVSIILVCLMLAIMTRLDFENRERR